MSASVPLLALNIHRGLDLAPVALRQCLHDYSRTFAIFSVQEKELTARQHGPPSYDLLLLVGCGFTSRATFGPLGTPLAVAVVAAT